MSADPGQKDSDWLLFRSNKFDELFKAKTPNFSRLGSDIGPRALKRSGRRASTSSSS